MSFARSGISLLLGLAAITAAAAAAAGDLPPADPAPPKHEPRLSVAKDAPTKEAPAKAAMALHDEAWTLYEEGKYRAAVAKLEAALRIDPNGRELIYNLALLHEKLADLKESVAYYRQYLETETDPKARARIQATLRRLEGAEKEAAEAPLSPLATSAPPPPPAPRPVRPAVVVTAGIAGAALVVGTVFGITAVAKNPGSDPQTGNGVSAADLQTAAHTAHTDAMVADVSFVVAAVAAGTATVLYLTTPRPTPPPASAQARPGLTPMRAVAVGPGLLRASF